MPHSRQLAAITIAVLALYYEIYCWIPLGRWNWQFRFPVDNDQFYPDIVIGLLLLWFASSFATGSKSGMYTAAILLSVWTILHLFDWWIPYLHNNPANFARFSFYRPHTQLLPVIGNHYPPDAGHAVLDFILYPTCIATIYATFPSKPKDQKANHV